MRTRFTGLVGIAVLVLIVPLSVSAYDFFRNLRLGDSGQDVYELQKALNADVRTRVASAGPGSSGNETVFFGALTADAVRRYQELYAQEILVPQGLSAGTGYFGQATRNHMEKTVAASQKKDPESDRGFVQNNVLTPEEITELNRENVDEAIQVVKNSLKDEDLSGDQIDDIEAEFRRQAGLTFGELQNEFEMSRKKLGKVGKEGRTPEEIIEDMEEQYGVVIPEGPMTTFAEALLQMILPKPIPAQAQYFIPIGGIILSYYLCSCSGVWYIVLGPPRPGTVTYETGTQYYMYWNLPYSEYLVGYSVPINPTCWIPVGSGCGPVPSYYGILTPVVGSSAL